MSSPMASTCKYDIGVNSIWLNSVSSNVSLAGVAQWYPASVVYDAFRYAGLNGGKAGIYEKIPNTNLTTFQPTDDDIVGY
ncbi:hypothetical protein OCU04_007838 [Sclerotinia nivalis]|uniref:Uncharacterized protein n=1 Tax=Sclerotinia nivalis TaxID=352851 RepID=A0A9X0DKE1_9HELO|nr:hypothetical protein OCU04_007838 [Sclerotinia nivalis]